MFTWELYYGGSIAIPVDDENAIDSRIVLDEVMEWLGVSFSDYLDFLELEKGAIFDRAQY